MLGWATLSVLGWDISAKNDGKLPESGLLTL